MKLRKRPTRNYNLPNEEILSSNEELQSTNEELETAKEELQSTNEELTTLNEELQNRNQELGVANSDLLNLLASVNVPILMLGVDLRIRHFTAAAEKLLNLIPTDVGRSINDIKTNLAMDDLGENISGAIQNLSARESEMQDLQGRWYAMRIRPYITSDGKIDGVVITWFDITSLKAAQEGTAKALGEVEGRYRALFERNLAGVFRVTVSGRFLECNSAFARVFRYESPAEILRLTAGEVFCSGESMQSMGARLKEARGPVNFQLHMCRKDGGQIWILMNAVLVEGGGTPEPEIEGIVLDISEHRQAEESLRQLSTQLTSLQDAERKRISRELHDVTGSGLTALIANLALVKKASEKLDAKARKALIESLQLARQCSQEIRTVSYLLHPPLLDEMGLASALRWYVDGFSERSQVRVNVALPSDLGRLPPEVEASIFQIVQESLTNIHRHSGSATASIELTQAGEEITLEVADQGKGIPAPTAKTDHEPGKARAGVGIPSMRERVRQLGGKFEIISGVQGTTVRAVFSLDRAEEAASPVPEVARREEKQESTSAPNRLEAGGASQEVASREEESDSTAESSS